MAAVADDSKKMITLMSSDGEEFEVEEAVVMEWQTIRDMFDEWPDNAIRLSNVNSSVLSKVIEYCNKHVQAAKSNTSSAEGGATAAGADGRSSAPAPTEELKNWDAEFVELDFKTLCDLILAANYLNIRGLLDLTCNTTTDMVKGKTPEDLRKLFNNNDDFNFTAEDEEEIRRENQWAFE